MKSPTKSSVHKTAIICGTAFEFVRVWVKAMIEDPAVKAEHLGKIPVGAIALDSERDDGRAYEMWEACRNFFGEEILKSSDEEVLRHERDGIVAFSSGDMTWTLFILPIDLLRVLAKQGIVGEIEIGA